MTVRQKIGILLLLMGMVAAVGVGILRFQFESKYKNVEIIWDEEEVAELARILQIPTSDIYREFEQMGGTSVALSENTIPELLASGEISRKSDGSYDLVKVEEIRRAGLTIVPRPLNHPAFSESDIIQKFEILRKHFPGSLLIFDEDQVLGMGGWIRRVGEEIQNGKFIYGYVEFADQHGDGALKTTSYPRVTRVHSIPREELEEMSIDKAFRRYKRAVQERNVRALYVHMHPWASPGSNLLRTNLHMVKKLSEELVASGFQLGKVRVMEDFTVARFALGVVLVGLAGGVILLPIAIPWILAFLVVIAFLGLWGIGGGNVSALRWLALVAACALPLTVFELAIAHPETRKGTISGALGRAAMVLFLSLGSGLIVASVLSETSFFAGHSNFAGVKLAFAIPLLVVLFRIFQISDLNRFRDLLSRPLSIGTSVGIGLFAVGALVYILRTGNFGLPLFPFEESIRVGLEEMMGVRPRSREFLIGYPSLIILELGSVALGTLFPWLRAAAVLIPISVINTFAHLHIPLAVSVLRTLYGFLVGSALGTVAFFIWKFMRKP